jgi:PAS domain S-box-containing protein
MPLPRPAEVQSDTFPVMPAESEQRAIDTSALRPRESLRLAMRERGTIRDYLLAVVSVGTAGSLTSILHSYMQGTLMPLFFGAVMLTAWMGGFWPGLVATLLSILAMDQMIVPSEYFNVAELFGLCLFGAISVATSSLNALRKYTHDVLRRQQLELELRVADRTREYMETNRRLQEEISDRRRVQSTLLESEERFRSMFEEAPIAYHEIDRHGVIRRVNRAECELLEKPAEEVLGKAVWELVAPEQADVSRVEVMRKLAGTKALEPFTRQYATTSGRRILFEIHERAIVDPAGAIVGIRSALLDITARVSAEEHIRKLNTELELRVKARTTELQRSNEALQQFAYSASHDLQEPLRMVAAYTRLLERRYKDVFDDDGREYMHYIVDGAERMSRLIRDLLAFSRAGNASPEPPEELDMREVFDTAVLNVRGSIEDTHAVIEAGGLPRIRCRRAGLSQVLQNLFSNSMKYRSADAPRIRITCTESDEEWVFCVADNGVGFEQVHAERVFGVFQRLHGRTYPGTGIGLAICKRIIERNGGRMWAESKPGAGSRFYFTLPRNAHMEDVIESVPR